MAREASPLVQSEDNEKGKSQSSNDGPAFRPVKLPNFITAPSPIEQQPKRVPAEFTFFVREQVEQSANSEKDNSKTDKEKSDKSSKNGKATVTSTQLPVEKTISYHAAPEAVNYASVNFEPDAETNSDDLQSDDQAAPEMADKSPYVLPSNEHNVYTRPDTSGFEEKTVTNQSSASASTGTPVVPPTQPVSSAQWQQPPRVEQPFPTMHGQLESTSSPSFSAYEDLPPVPPTGPTEHATFNEPPEPPMPPTQKYAYSYGNSPQPTMYNTAPPSPAVTPSVERTPLPETVNAVDRPARALTALEYLLRKRADRKLEKRVNERIDAADKRHEATAIDNQLRVQVEQRQQNTEIRNLQQPYRAEQVPIPHPMAQENYPMPAALQAPETHFNTPHSMDAPLISQERPLPRTETLPPIKPVEKLLPIDETPEAAPVHLNPGDHLRQSAWHTYAEKDTEAISYGKAFQQELRSEVTPTSSRGNDAAGSTSSYQQYTPAQYSHPGMLPSGMTSPTLPTGQPTHVDPQHQLSAQNKKTFTAPGPLFWVMFAALLVAFFAAAII